MNLFLFKPHIVGPKGAITTPDVVVDKLMMVSEGSTLTLPISVLGSCQWQQVTPDSCVACCYALTALGGGVVISPGVAIGDGRLIIARSGWRLNNIIEHADQVMLNQHPLTDLWLPQVLIEQAGGRQNHLPAGEMIVYKTDPVDTSDSISVVLHDPVLNRSLEMNVALQVIGLEQPQDRELPRYSVGPTQRDVDHYI